MLCPFCQQPVRHFEPSGDGAHGLRCPLCNEDGVPPLYPQDYDQHPAVAVSICGATGHGKTVLVEALLTQLERGIRWPGFSCQWMNESGMWETRLRLKELHEHGKIPNATNEVFPRPQVLRLRNIPTVGGCQLLFYDTGGEVFKYADKLSDAARYVRNSRAVIWLVSLKDLEYPEQISDLMTVYAAAMHRMGANPRQQAVVVVLTKGDLLLDAPDLPTAARQFLLDDRLTPGPDAWQRLETVSDALEGWLLVGDQRNLVNLLRSQFRQVRFCIISAQGIAARDQVLPVKIMPRGVLAPLFWVWRESLPAAWVEPNDGSSPTPYFSLDAALDAAPPGGTIRLVAPSYTVRPRLVVHKPVKVVGSGAVEIRGSGDWAVLTIDVPDGEVSLAGITVRHDGPIPADVIRVNRGKLLLQQCTISGGVAGKGPPEVSGDGIRVMGTGESVLHQCVVELNQGSGVTGHQQAQITVTRSRLTRNRRSGVYAAGVKAEVYDSDVTDNGATGVYLAGGVRGRVYRSGCNRNQKNGVLVAGSATAELDENGMHNNKVHGVAAKDRAVVAVHKNQCSTNEGAGIALVDRVTGSITQNTCSGNRRHGIAAEGASAANVTENNCARNRQSGIHYAGTAAGTCLDNTCLGNLEHGIRVAGAASPQVDRNTCTANACCGFLVEEAAKPEFGQKNAAGGNKKGDFRPEQLRKRGWFG